MQDTLVALAIRLARFEAFGEALDIIAASESTDQAYTEIRNLRVTVRPRSEAPTQAKEPSPSHDGFDRVLRTPRTADATIKEWEQFRCAVAMVLEPLGDFGTRTFKAGDRTITDLSDAFMATSPRRERANDDERKQLEHGNRVADRGPPLRVPDSGGGACGVDVPGVAPAVTPNACQCRRIRELFP